jgi:hypothetical protein
VRRGQGWLIGEKRLAVAQLVDVTEQVRAALLMSQMMTTAWAAQDENYQQADCEHMYLGVTSTPAFPDALSALCVDCSAAIRPGVDDG